MKECQIIDLFTNKCKLKNNSPEVKDEAILNIKKELKNGNLNPILKDLINGGNKDLIFNDNNTIYQITSTNNQNNNKYDNLSVVILGKCETILREKYNISKNETLLMLKLDIFEEGSLIPLVEYEVYDSKEKHQQLNLGYCNNTKINIVLSVIIDTKEEFKYNPSSDYYNNICYTYTTKNNTDITLNDRRNEYNKNNMSLCETKCEYDGYDKDEKKAKCECEVKFKIPLMSEIVINKNKFNKLSKIKNIMNLNIMKCYKNLFSIDGLIKNICSYALLSMIFINICTFFVFVIKGQYSIWRVINIISDFKNKFIKTDVSKNGINNKSKSKIINKNKNINKKEITNKMKKKNINKYKKEIMNKKKNKKTKKLAGIKLGKRIKNKNIKKLHIKNGLINIINVFKGKKGKNNDNKKRKNKNPPIEKKPESKNKNLNLIETNENKIENNSYFLLKQNSKFIKNQKKVKNKNNLLLNVNLNSNTINKKTNSILKLNDYELNVLEYNNALKIDKRNYVQYYFSLLRRKQVLIFTFYTYDDYNSRTMKICLFFFSFSFYFAINALFFRDSTMHKIYEDGGNYDFVYQIPQILYSAIISNVINIIIKYLSLYEKNIIEIKRQNYYTKQNIITVVKCIKIKIILFFIFIFLFMSLFWYYLACFGLVYKNTQLHLIKDTLSSFTLSLFYPIGLCLIPGIFRIPALKTKKGNRECLYKFSQFIQFIL